MAYRASKTEPATRWARHLDAVLRKRDWSRVRMFEEVGPAMGLGAKSRSAFLPLLEDREPDAPQAAVLRAHFGEPPEADEPAPTETQAMSSNADLVAAIREQTAAINAQTQMLQAVLVALARPDADDLAWQEQALADATRT